VDQPLPGSFTVRLLDDVDRPLNETSFGIRFFAETDPPIEVDTVSFGLAVPFPAQTVDVEIQQDNQTLRRFNALSRVLHDAIDAIPASAFKQSPGPLRSALHNKVDAIEKMLDARAYKGAYEALSKDLAALVNQWLSEGDVRTDPLELEKAEVVAVITAIADRVAGLER
jgi:hypothetical protein